MSMSGRRRKKTQSRARTLSRIGKGYLQGKAKRVPKKERGEIMGRAPEPNETRRTILKITGRVKADRRVVFTAGERSICGMYPYRKGGAGGELVSSSREPSRQRSCAVVYLGAEEK